MPPASFSIFDRDRRRHCACNEATPGLHHAGCGSIRAQPVMGACQSRAGHPGRRLHRRPPPPNARGRGVAPPQPPGERLPHGRGPRSSARLRGGGLQLWRAGAPAAPRARPPRRGLPRAVGAGRTARLLGAGWGAAVPAALLRGDRAPQQHRPCGQQQHHPRGRAAGRRQDVAGEGPPSGRRLRAAAGAAGDPARRGAERRRVGGGCAGRRRRDGARARARPLGRRGGVPRVAGRRPFAGKGALPPGGRCPRLGCGQPRRGRVDSTSRRVGRVAAGDPRGALCALAVRRDGRLLSARDVPHRRPGRRLGPRAAQLVLLVLEGTAAVRTGALFSAGVAAVRREEGLGAQGPAREADGLRRRGRRGAETGRPPNGQPPQV
mmetsp:Transcript_5602/g.13607  ORF Transcript_5602/g.13607 Transcript_5602/m.13607 type:complete len:378 (+) Transcript_5602:86-1219(+)